MLKYILGIVLVQLITVVLTLVFKDSQAWWQLGVLLGLIACLGAFATHSLVQQQNIETVHKLRESHAKERESIRVNAERDKTRLVQAAQKETLNEIRRTSAQANLKLGVAVAGMAGIGAVLLFTQFVILGGLTLATAGGAAGGYLLRWRQEKLKSLPVADNEPRLIHSSTKNIQ